MVDFDAYQLAALRTAGDKAEDFACHAMGLAGEAGEVVDLLKKHLYHGHALDTGALAKELGDVLWYVAVLAHRSGLMLSAVASGMLDGPATPIWCNALRLCAETSYVVGLVESLIDGVVVPRSHQRYALGVVLNRIASIASVIDLDLAEVAAINIAKLKVRYPDGFTAERSMNREE